MSDRRARVQGEGSWWLRADDKRREGPKRPGSIAWAEHEEAWRAYAARYGNDQDAERIHERGGFSYNELVDLLKREPATWREREPPP